MGQIFRLWELLGGVGGVRWKLLEPSEEHIECLRAMFRPLMALLGRLGGRWFFFVSPRSSSPGRGAHPE
eukprot:4123185-Pyramimonas_sp.AAC.1